MSTVQPRPLSYEDAFYDIGKLLGLPAMPISPCEAYINHVRPRIVELLAGAAK
jgi:hypothetical protein